MKILIDDFDRMMYGELQKYKRVVIKGMALKYRRFRFDIFYSYWKLEKAGFNVRVVSKNKVVLYEECDIDKVQENPIKV